MEKKRRTAHIVSHSHWDREWYLPLESLRFRLVTLMDELEDLFEKDAGFQYFHMDGQMIMLEDYLAVRPEKREKVVELVKAGKLRIGPWYMLQDAFLTSGEANVRNLQYGLQLASHYGEPEKIGYFPDTFGLYGQVPQLMKQAGFETIFFGRGVNPTGFNNQVFDSAFSSRFSELYWQSPDGSRLPAVLFANWYSNGNEIPVDSEAARVFWDKKLADSERFAATEHLLFMNGCDHQPVQTDVAAALETARALYPDIEFVHSNLTDYAEAVRDAASGLELQTVHGELTSQNSDGWSTLANTASSRMYLKQANHRLQWLLTHMAEPLSVLAAERTGAAYPHDYLAYTWKLLMENGIHDSITGCSLDSVHSEMETRFVKVEQAASAIIERAAGKLTERIQPEQDGIPLTVFAASGTSGGSRLVETVIETDHIYFDQMDFREIPDELATRPEQTFRLRHADGEEVPVRVESLGIQFGYDLPDRKFRHSYFARKYRLTFVVENLPQVGYATYYAEPARVAETPDQMEAGAPFTLENEWLRVTVAADGRYTILDKRTGEQVAELGGYEDAGDIGNEYMFKETGDEKRIKTAGLPAEIRFTVKDAVSQSIEIRHRIRVPLSADTASLDEEKRRLVWHPERVSGRSGLLVEQELITTLTLSGGQKVLKVETHLENQAEDHRLRVLFPTGGPTDAHSADSVFEIVRRPNQPSDSWQNPSSDQRMQNFVHCGQVAVIAEGLPEYEVARDGSVIELTLFRAVSEIGDWGDFPAPEAQTKRALTFTYYVMLADAPPVEAAQQILAPVYLMQHRRPKIALELPGRLERADWATSGSLVFSSLKKNQQNETVVRFYQPTDETAMIEFAAPHAKSTILEREKGERNTAFTIRPFEIVTFIKEQNDGNSY
ncbi:alpha-mannosidase [Listeria costaricensis]|uniref:alpha-mannosidase n=1 Tax=Listeria costaricensis TaxID=2026604 RepID=UPI000C07310B|nr:alpha-mannosidase [Listeria costaricensis]